MKISSLNKFNHEIIKKFVNKNSFVIDATCGNGNDTLFLAEIAKNGKVYAFDIQQEAITNTQNRCQNFTNIKYILDSHENFDNHINHEVDFIIYNLGYLPNSDHQVTTTFSSTINSIKNGLYFLINEGAISIMIYTNHDNHTEETEVLKFISTLSKYEFNILKYEFLNLNNSPYLIIIEKK